MPSPTLILAAAEGNRLSQPLRLTPQNGTTYTHAVRGMRFVITDPEQPGQPAQLIAKRVGKNLLVSLPDEAEPRLVIYDFYGSDAQLEGIGEDGKLHSWVTSDDQQYAESLDENDHAFLQLNDDDSTATPLFMPVHDSGMWLAMAAFAGLLGLGGIVLAMQNQHSGPGESPPPSPVINIAEDDIGIYTGTHASGGLTDDANPTFSGTGSVPGNIIFLYAEGELLGSTLVNADGSWALTSDIALSHGEHRITATESSPRGFVSLPSSEFLLHVDLIAPGRPLLVSVEDDSGIFTGLLSGEAITDDNLPLFNGTAEPGALITFSIDGNEIASAVVDASGNWSWQPDVAIEDGTHRFTAQATDPAGNISLPSKAFVFTVDTLPPTSPSLIDAVDNITGGIEGGDIGNNGLTNDPRPVFSGSAEANCLVRIIDASGEVIASVTADPNGNWSWQPEVAFEEGLQQLIFTAQDAAGNLSPASEPYCFTVDTLAPAAPAITSALDYVKGGVQDGSDIGNSGLTNDARPVIGGIAEAGSLVRIISAGGTVLASVHADTRGNWRWQSATALPEGVNTFTVTAEDAAGNLSAASASYGFTVDTIAPNQVSVTFSDSQNQLITIGGTNSSEIKLSGTALAGEIVYVWEGNNLLGTVTVDVNGQWVIPVTFFDERIYNFQTEVFDVAGNSSGKSVMIPFEYDASPPPSLKAIDWDGENLEIQIDGSQYQAGDLIKLNVDGTVMDITLTAKDLTSGVISIPWSSTTNGDADNFNVTISDRYGNTSAATELTRQLGPRVMDSFDSQPYVKFANGDSVDMTNFTLNIINAAGAEFTKGQSNWTYPSPTMALTMYAKSHIEIDVHGKGYDFIAFKAGDFTPGEIFTVTFYDEHNNQVATYELTPGAGLEQDLFCKVPYGQTFSKVSLELNYSGVWIDDFTVGNTTYESNIPQSSFGTLFVTEETQWNCNLDKLSVLIDSEMQSVIDATDGVHILHVSAEAVLTLGQEDLFLESGMKQLMINGDAGDVVVLESLLGNDHATESWNNQGQITVTGVTYEVWQDESLQVEVLIQQGMQIYEK